MRARRHHIVAAVLASMLALTSCGGDGDDASGTTDESTTTTAADSGAGDTDDADASARVAEAIPAQVQVYATASEDEPTTALDNPNEHGAPLVFLVDEEHEGGEWLKVHLPIRPNGSTGYVRVADVDVVDNPYRIDIALADHRLTVTKGDELIADEPVGVGTASTPTPGGVYYIKELLQPPQPDGPYGPYAYGLSGFSNELDDFAGGEGVIGIHGTNEPEAIGSDVSHGCIRMSNDAITELAGILPLGTPVHIAA